MSKWEDTYIAAVVSMPIYWVLVMLPAQLRAKKVVAHHGGDLQAINAEPRKAVEAVGQSNSPEASFVRRATACHQHGWETFTVYISAVVAATLAPTTDVVKPSFVNTCCVLHILLRAAFTVAYLSIESGPLSFLRSFCFLGMMATCCALWVKAALTIADV